ncbi:MAG: type II secretion system protein [Methylobacillus glycogenes]|nr:type II secretion system protein [Methylobacillus glycogenes]
MMIAISGIGLAALGQAWHTASQRDKEVELLFVGAQISKAISAYREATPSPVKQYPNSLEALLNDKRGPKPARHLRKIYIDPMTGTREWGLIKDANSITGVYSLSRLKPFKQDNFDDDLQGFAGAASYRDWHFVANDKAGSVYAIPKETSPQTPTDPAAPTQPALPVSNSPALAGGGANTEKYARCGSSLDAAQLSCHSGCGLASSPACRSCLQAAFDGYRQCLR